MGRRIMIAAASTAAVLAAAGGAHAQTACEGLTGLKLDHASVTGATVIAASGALPAYCKVLVTSKPTPDSDIRIEVAIPEGAAWNGRYLQVGNGGFAGTIPESSIRVGLAKGFATAATDDGHQDPIGTDASWALGHPEKVKDFGYRALKETTLAARAVIAAYEAKPVAKAYFAGCSDGGREALMEAQRYPDDFDGILAGDPANHWTHLLAAAAWNAQALSATPGSYIPASKLKAIETAEQKACGDADGVIENPLACHFDPAVIRCKAGDSDQCLTGEQVTALKKIYAGARDPRTGAHILAGFDPGGEAEPGGWGVWLVGAAPGAKGHAAQYEFGRNFYQFIAFGDANYDITKLTFGAQLDPIDAKWGPVLNSWSDDLSAFKARGGKLIQYHGWADPAIPPRDSIDYFGRVQKKMGNTASFYRLFMAPGMLHCGGGLGPNPVHGVGLDALTAWVEDGKAPDQLVVAKRAGDSPAGPVLRTRPLCAFPRRAEWDGKGDRDKAESWRCVAGKG
ncbi:tannase/feruloyl esterase family alpha/beta hydrolase [Phenylobacterium montanum]|uniref:Tannase/feruloyl esterase family alpha/beta hydrolase n=1 Tax=Phenylobacterium montanum TaxID=2823693 RepID=A0A975IWR0_9CAUL|nr:tannase/feruloyl esterase family alpha/beta hydrolase [Caulobacter sp. S6]QUD90105.1 tannase/feruloyl esterase family alpha/beta hydrolase [Caulobacter sp. S6]